MPLFVFDAGYSAAALTDGLAGCPAHVLVRLPAGSVFYQDAPSWPGKNGRPAHRGPEVHCLEQEALAAAAEGRGSRGRKKPLPPAPEPDETLILPDTPLYGTVRGSPDLKRLVDACLQMLANVALVEQWSRAEARLNCAYGELVAR